MLPTESKGVDQAFSKPVSTVPAAAPEPPHRRQRRRRVSAPPTAPSRGKQAIDWPEGVLSGNIFSGLNALSWQIMLGAPVILYAKSQGASATMLGLVAALAPLMAIFQIPAAYLMARLGYKRLILAGWSARTVVVFMVAVVPLLSFLEPGSRLWLVVLCLALFNAFRGIAAGAWMPWICEWIPEPLRGRFLSRDQLFCQAGSLVAALASAALLGGTTEAWGFALVFLLSALSASVSLFFVKRIPDVMAPERRRQSGHHVPWGHMLTWPPFYRLLTFNLLWVMAASGLMVFTVSLMRGIAGYSESQILLFTGLGIVGAMVSVRGVGQLVDGGRNRLVLGLCMVAIVFTAAGWWAVASGVLGQGVLIVALLNFVLGATSVNFAIANGRLAMATFPLMGRNHFFAMFNVITNVSAGLVPIGWGIMIDAIGPRTLTMGGVVWNRYSFYFAAVTALGLLGLAAARWLHEPPAQDASACPPPPVAANQQMTVA